MLYVHTFCNFLKNRFSGHSTFVLQTIDVHVQSCHMTVTLSTDLKARL